MFPIEIIMLNTNFTIFSKLLNKNIYCRTEHKIYLLKKFFFLKIPIKQIQTKFSFLNQSQLINGKGEITTYSNNVVRVPIMKNLRRIIYYPHPLPHFGVKSITFKDVEKSIKMVLKKRPLVIEVLIGLLKKVFPCFHFNSEPLLHTIIIYSIDFIFVGGASEM